jgi:hypothetical protein
MAWDTRHLKMAQDIKRSNRGYLSVQRRTGVEEHLSETHALSAISSMVQADCQGVLRGPSVGVVPILLRNCLSSTTLSSAAGTISSMADVCTYLYMCFRFYASCLKEMLLQTLKRSVWVTSTRRIYIVLSPVHQYQVNCYGHGVCIPRSFDRN